MVVVGFVIPGNHSSNTQPYTEVKYDGKLAVIKYACLYLRVATFPDQSRNSACTKVLRPRDALRLDTPPRVNNAWYFVNAS